jgi:uncharacterized membrane protein
MLPKVTAPLRKALRQLEAEKQRIDREIAAVRAALKALGDTGRGAPASARAGARQRRMSVAARRAVSQRMKAYWAKRRAASAKGKARGTR